MTGYFYGGGGMAGAHLRCKHGKTSLTGMCEHRPDDTGPTPSLFSCLWVFLRRKLR